MEHERRFIGSFPANNIAQRGLNVREKVVSLSKEKVGAQSSLPLMHVNGLFENRVNYGHLARPEVTRGGGRCPTP